VAGQTRIEFYGRTGGVIPAPEEVWEYLETLLEDNTAAKGQPVARNMEGAPS
jgi:hypothetical protein